VASYSRTHATPAPSAVIVVVVQTSAQGGGRSDGPQGMVRVTRKDDAPSSAGFGFRVAVLHDTRHGSGAVVSHVTHGGPAHAAGLCVGHQLLSINDVDLHDATSAELATLLAASGKSLLLHTTPKDELLSRFEAERANATTRGRAQPQPARGPGGSVTIPRGADGTFGLAFRDSKKSGTVTVSRVVPGGAAWHDGRVQQGMEVTDINGVDIEGLHADAIARLLTSTVPDALMLGLATDGFRHVTLTPSAAGSAVGLVLGGAPDPASVRQGVRGVFVSGSLPDSPANIAQRDGSLVLGHQVLEINGLSTTQATLADVLPLLSTASTGTTPITMATAPNIALVELYVMTPLPPRPSARRKL
jgi:hypothetical protein